MNTKFQPVSTEPFPLGSIGNQSFSVVLDKDRIYRGTLNHPHLFFLIVPNDKKLTWKMWEKGNDVSFAIIGDKIGDILQHFFGTALPLQKVAWQLEVDSKVGPIQIQFEVGHNDDLKNRSLIP